MGKPVVSVVIPVYNTAKYLHRCLQSVCSQTYEDWELLAVDDGSTDDSYKILSEWSQRDCRIKCIHKSNEGVVAAREYAVNRAEGEFLFFLDSDDWLPDDALQTMLHAMEVAGADLCVGSYTLVWEDSDRRKIVNHRKAFRNAKGCFEYCLRFGEMFLPIKLYKTSIYRDYVHIPKGIIVQEDVIGVTQYLEHCDSVTFTEQSVYYYFKHSGTATTGKTLSHIRSVIDVAEFLLHCNFCEKSTFRIHLYCAKSLRYCMSSPLIDYASVQRARLLMSQLTWASKCVTFATSCVDLLSTKVKKLIKR